MARSPRVPAELIQPYLLDVPHPRSPTWREQAPTPRPIAWPEIFGNDRPVEIEVGAGKGMFLINAGQAHADVNFLGIELERKYVLFTAARLVKHGVGNVRLACTDARWLLKERVPAGSVQAVHVYFPDPWWKQRHQKRKLFTAEFARQCARVLQAGGTLNFATDVEEYFAATCAMLAEQNLLRPMEWPVGDADGSLTHFERKYRREGRPIHRARFRAEA